MIRLLCRRLLIVSVTILAVLLVWTFVFRITMIPPVRACIYNYKYFDENADGSLGKYKNDSVDISVQNDVESLHTLLNVKLALFDFDYIAGFSEEYSVDFISILGIKMRFEICFGGQNGRIRLANTPLTLQLNQDEIAQFYEVLQKYHNYEHVALAG